MTPFSHPAHRTGQADLPHPALGQDFTPLLSRATPSAVSEHSAEFIGCPISRSFTTYFVCLELRSLPSTGITRLQRYYEPLRHPKAPGLSLTGLRLVVADRALGLPVFRALSLCTCCRHYPGAASGRITSLISSRRSSLPRKGCRVGLRIVLFEACSAFTRVAACTLALPPIRDTLIEGFSHFVTSMTAPIASGWSGCRVGLAPTGKRRLVTAHTRSGHRASMKDGALSRPLNEQRPDFRIGVLDHRTDTKAGPHVSRSYERAGAGVDFERIVLHRTTGKQTARNDADHRADDDVDANRNCRMI